MDHLALCLIRHRGATDCMPLLESTRYWSKKLCIQPNFHFDLKELSKEIRSFKYVNLMALHWAASKAFEVLRKFEKSGGLSPST